MKNNINWEEIFLYGNEIREELHKYPELGLEEYKTSQKIEEELQKLRVDYVKIPPTGILATIKGENQDKTLEKRKIALRADIDALPIQEENDIPFKSKVDGKMHACGHDIHTASLLAATKALSENRDLFAGEIKIIFQPAEEIGKGAKLFKNLVELQDIDRVFGIHVDPKLKIGTVGVKPGQNNAAVDFFRITVKGKSTHVSTPQLGIDALFIASKIVTSIQSIVTRLTSPIQPVVIGIGKLEAGSAYNVVAEKAVLEGTLRTFSHEIRKETLEKIEKLAKNIADIYGGDIDIFVEDFTPPLVNNEEACKEIEDIVNQNIDELDVINNRELSLGGDDFAEFLHIAKGAYVYIGTQNEDEDSKNTVHHPKFNPDNRAIKYSAKLHYNYALWWLTHKEKELIKIERKENKKLNLQY